MVIEYANGLFLAIIKFEERQGFIDAGWKWNADLKRWSTADFAKADNFSPFTTPVAQVALDVWRKSQFGELALSCAVECGIDVPSPDGLMFDPPQKSGILYASKRKDTLIADPPGIGKGGPLWAKILTPTGWTTYGNVKVGDKIIGSDGRPHAVTAVFDRGVLPVFRVVFSDGASTVVDGDHIWSVRGPNYRKRSGEHATPAWRTLTTREIIGKISYPGGDSRKFRIPIVAPVIFGRRRAPWIIAPYTLGILLGDGGIKYSLRLSSNDRSILQRVRRELPITLRLRHVSGCDYAISNKKKGWQENVYKAALRSFGLHGLGSDDKFVPKPYLLSSQKDRWEILRGLLDSDGTCLKNGTIQFSSNSQRLAHDVEFLIRSLGGVTRWTEGPSSSGKMHYTVTPAFPEGASPFALRRKAIRHADRTKYPPMRVFRSIEPAGHEAVRCISVDSPDNLYVTDDFIVTHNTMQAIGVSNYIPEIQRVLIVSPAHLKVLWQQEWAKWCVKGLSIGEAKSVTKSEAVRDAAGKSVKRRTWTEYIWPDAKVVVINYDMLPTFQEQIEGTTWDLAIFDESQYLVSEQAQRSRYVFGAKAQKVRKTPTKKGFWRPAVRGIQTKRRIFLSGTPILSRPIDIWTLCKACDPAGLGKDWEDFVYTYCGAHTIGAGTDKQRLDTSGASNLSELQRILRTRFMVRRPKSILKLKEKRRQLIPLPQEGLVKLVEAEMTAGERVRAALAAFEALDVEQPSKEEAPWTTLADALERRFAGWQDRSYEDCIQYLGAAEQQAFEELSLARKALAKAKIPMVKEHLEGLLATGAKVVCFLVHTEIAEALRVHFPTAAFITGRIAPNKRQAKVDRFQDDPACRLMIANITAGGTGFTMTAGTIVVFAELDWVPARVEQGEDRCHRRGQTEMVLVQHLAVEGSLDVRLVEVLLQKQMVVEAALDHTTLPEFASIETILRKEIEDDSRAASIFSLHSAN